MMTKSFIFALFSGLLLGCQPVVDEFNRPIGELPSSTVSTSTTSAPKKKDCGLAPFRVKHVGPGNRWNRVISMPHVGKFVGESHYLTNADTHIARSPRTVTHGIEKHLERECEIYRKQVQDVSCDQLFSTRWDKQWTPSENGPIGIGSRGLEWQRKNLTPEQEMWGMNMMWGPGERPAAGTKFILNHGGKSVVAYAGHETGPGSKEFVGGVSPAIQFYLGATNDSQVVIGYPKDQSLPLGPIDCEIL